MTQTIERPAPSLNRQGRAVLGDRAFWLLSLVAGLLVLAILGLILFTTVKYAIPAFQAEGTGFFTSSTWIPNDPDGSGPQVARFGALTFIYGTVIVSVLSLLIAVPVSIGIALFLTELAHRRVRGIAITIIDLLAAVPSVVFGLWAILVVAPALVPVYTWIHDLVAPVPVIGTLLGVPVSSGRNFMTASLILAAMITPIITSITREVFATVPAADKQAALALGATRWEMIRGAVFPHSFGGMVGAIMLGLGRAMGETIAVSLTIGAVAQISPNVFASGNALPAVIVQNWNESGGTFQSALIGCGVVLFVVTVIVNLGARSVVRRAEIRMKGTA